MKENIIFIGREKEGYDPHFLNIFLFVWVIVLSLFVVHLIISKSLEADTYTKSPYLPFALTGILCSACKQQTDRTCGVFCRFLRNLGIGLVNFYQTTASHGNCKRVAKLINYSKDSQTQRILRDTQKDADSMWERCRSHIEPWNLDKMV